MKQTERDRTYNEAIGVAVGVLCGEVKNAPELAADVIDQLDDAGFIAYGSPAPEQSATTASVPSYKAVDLSRDDCLTILMWWRDFRKHSPLSGAPEHRHLADRLVDTSVHAYKADDDG